MTQEILKLSKEHRRVGECSDISLQKSSINELAMTITQLMSHEDRKPKNETEQLKMRSKKIENRTSNHRNLKSEENEKKERKRKSVFG